MLGREVLDGRQLQPARLDALAHRPQVPFVPEALLVRHHLAGLVGENDMGRPQLPGELHVPGREPGRGAGVTRERQRELGHRPRPTHPSHSHRPTHTEAESLLSLLGEGGSAWRGARRTEGSATTKAKAADSRASRPGYEYVGGGV